MSSQNFFDITDEYRVTSDKYQYIILKKRIVEDEDSKNYGQISWDTEAFLPKIEDVLEFFTEKGIKENLGDIHMINEWIKGISAAFQEFLKAYKDREEQR